MATTLAEHIVGKLIAASVVEEADRELYVYGFFLLISRLFFFLVAAVFGCFLGIPWESVIFYIVFILLRSYAGGVHAKTEKACTGWTTLAMGIAVAAIKTLEASNGKALPLLIFSNLCLLLFTPHKLLDSQGNPTGSYATCTYSYYYKFYNYVCAAGHHTPGPRETIYNNDHTCGSR